MDKENRRCRRRKYMHICIHHFVQKWISGDSVRMCLTTGYTRVRLCKIAQLILAKLGAFTLRKTEAHKKNGIKGNTPLMSPGGRPNKCKAARSQLFSLSSHTHTTPRHKCNTHTHTGSLHIYTRGWFPLPQLSVNRLQGANIAHQPHSTR